MKTYEKLAGGTPLVRIDYKYKGEAQSLYAKLESFNPSGSIKDRMAARILTIAEEGGRLRAGQPIVEVSSGNTGIAFAALGALTHHPVHIFMPDWMSKERRQLLEMYGAQLHLVSREQGGFEGARRLARAAAARMDAFLPSQFENQANALAHYEGTGAEILAQLPDVAGFAAGVGTGGTLMGVARRLKPLGARIAAVEPDAAPLLKKGRVHGPHKIEGIGDDFLPALVRKEQIDQVVDVNDDDAVLMAARLSKELGLGVGISSGANFLGGVVMNRLLPGPVATVFADDNKKYLSTALASPAPAREDFLSPRIELLGWEKAQPARRWYFPQGLSC